MTALNLGQPRARHTRRKIPTHCFAVGDIVRLKDGFARPRTTVTTYQITGVLPPKGTSPQYRVRNHEERHERVATQDDLERISLAQTGVSLIERTFRNG